MKASVHPVYDTSKNAKYSVGTQSIGVLIVGNNPMELGQYCRSLINFREANFTIETAFNVVECFRHIVKFKPSIVVVDDSIGFMNMIAIADKMRSDASNAHVPLIIIKNSSYHHATLKKTVDAFLMLDRMLDGELPYLILDTIQLRKEKSNGTSEVGNEGGLDKKLSKLLMSLFSSHKAST